MLLFCISDVSTSGLLVFAKTATFQASFNTQLTKRTVEKLYRAIVDESRVQARLGLLRHWMLASGERDPPPRRVLVQPPSSPDERWVEALTEVQGRLPALCAVQSDHCVSCVAAPPPRSHLQWLTKLHLRLLTGRTHQIRASLGAEGCPLYGDVLYGFPNPHSLPLKDLRSLPLKAVELAFAERKSKTTRRYRLPDEDHDHG